MGRDAGTLGYSINGGPRFETLRGFPPAAALRLWAKLTSAHFTGPEEASDLARQRVGLKQQADSSGEITFDS
jgi:hypothetical protein